MEQRIKDRFSDEILEEAAARYGVAMGALRLLDGFESYIYEYSKGPSEYILRISHSIRRSEDLIQAEIDWINYLAQGGASVAAAIPSENDGWVEAIDDGRGGRFLATAFVKVQGRSPDERGWSPALYGTYGRLLGRMHALSRGYVPGNSAWGRPHWDDPIMLEVEKFLPAGDTGVRMRFRALMAALGKLPRDKTSYGLIHQDAHGGNLLISDAEDIVLFDFDDCAYSWFANDIAIVLFYISMGAEDPVAFTREFMRHFLDGYRKENRLEKEWISEIPQFLKLREIDLYAVIHRSYDVENLDDPWCERYMRGRKKRIESGVPYIDLDFAALATDLQCGGD